jgi:hypothetical protein
MSERQVQKYEDMILASMGHHSMNEDMQTCFVIALLNILCATIVASSTSAEDFEIKKDVLCRCLKKTLDMFEYDGEINVH